MASYTTLAKSGNPIRNNGATVLYGGKIDSSGTVTYAPDRDVFSRGNRVTLVASPASDGDIADGTTKSAYKPISAGDYSTMTANRYIMMRETHFIAGVANSLFNSGAAHFSVRRSIHYRESVRTLKQITAGWNYATGQFLTTPDVSVDEFGEDSEARSNRAIPGEFIYYSHGPATSGPLATGTQADYPKRTM